MRTLRGLAVLAPVSAMMFAPVASAQPGTSPPPPPPPAYGYPAPQPVALTMEDRRVLARGTISPEAHVGGAVVGFFVGFGSGQAVQGRWTDTGWIFTVGEAVAATVFFVRLDAMLEDCANNANCGSEFDGVAVVSLLGLFGLRVWEIVDSIAGPSSHNRRVRELHMRLGYQQPYYSLAPYVAPTRNGGGVAGITVRF